MIENLTTPFLPLGTILQISEADYKEQLYFVVARAITKLDSDEIVSRYRIAPHPYGDTPSQEILSINSEQITKVIFEGYKNQQDEEFLEELLKKMLEQSHEIETDEENRYEEVIETVMDDEIKLEEDPFFRFR